MRTVGAVAAQLVLRLLVEANKGRSVVTPNGGAGAAKDCGADTQGEKRLRGMGTFDGLELTRRGGPDEAPQAPALISQTPARACRIMLRQAQMSGCAKALDQREPSPNRSGRMAYTAIPAPARVFET